MSTNDGHSAKLIIQYFMMFADIWLHPPILRACGSRRVFDGTVFLRLSSGFPCNHSKKAWVMFGVPCSLSSMQKSVVILRTFHKNNSTVSICGLTMSHMTQSMAKALSIARLNPNAICIKGMVTVLHSPHEGTSGIPCPGVHFL